MYLHINKKKNYTELLITFLIPLILASKSGAEVRSQCHTCGADPDNTHVFHNILFYNVYVSS